MSKCKFYAIFDYAEDGISISFPDLPGCISSGYSTEEAIEMAKEALQLYLEDMNQKDIPQPSNKDSIEKIIKPNQKIYCIEV
ncbi:type II toxin-antitoxin system HicB family antitoxin [Acetivibrio clariflavus]|uniref:type II toxin-antitoxin system HicB family antitoxin n=1 Tax=Acetivibrio clariflavus TaxID=288965 RepID=UPI00047FDAF5|nr:type II toxin-antitoxin system HicB family antitoxin [Acetivibrio clariflavus]